MKDIKIKLKGKKSQFIGVLCNILRHSAKHIGSTEINASFCQGLQLKIPGQASPITSDASFAVHSVESSKEKTPQIKDPNVKGEVHTASEAHSDDYREM